MDENDKTIEVEYENLKNSYKFSTYGLSHGILPGFLRFLP
ncbi:hypothetical protein J2756_001192 [Methanobacterium aggregans]|nr:hypothetical protein [Methanobacterium aggregans]